MDGGGGGSDVAGGPAGSRWNPTKEQINLLEGFYRQGIRTPTAEQIQQITARLKVFGHIEGKNVFYWFQNHKARQRQKQKQQENVAYFNRHFRMGCYPPTNFQNVVCSPYYLPQNELGFLQRYPKVLIQSGLSPNRPMPNTFTTYHNADNLNEDSKQETLPLFPLEPTGVLENRNLSTKDSPTPSNIATPSSSNEVEEQSNFFDFFSGRYERD